MNKHKLEPCPFCGERELLDICDEGEGIASVCCIKCQASGPLKKRRHYAIAAWNVRTINEIGATK